MLDEIEIASGPVRVAKMRKALDNKVALGTVIKSFIEHQGFQVLKALFYNYRNEVKDKANYRDIHAFRADRKALKIIDRLFSELDAMVNDAEQAANELEKIIDYESSTPAILSLDGEGQDDGQDLV